MLDRWQPLACTCGGELFLDVKRLAWKVKGGTTANFAAYYCLSCGTVIDMETVLDKAQIALHVQELEASIAELQAPH